MKTLKKKIGKGLGYALGLVGFLVISIDHGEAASVYVPTVPAHQMQSQQSHYSGHQTSRYDGQVQGYVVCKDYGNTSTRSEGCLVREKSGEGFFDPQKEQLFAWEDYVERVTGRKGQVIGLAVAYDPNGIREVIVYYRRGE